MGFSRPDGGSHLSFRRGRSGGFVHDNGKPFPPWLLTGPQWIGNFTLTESWRANATSRLHVFGSPKCYLADVAWTLCYEEQFYAVCGFVLVLTHRRFFAGLALVTAVSALIWPLTLTRYGYLTNGLFFDGQWFLFAIGVGVYLIVTKVVRRIRAVGPS